MDEFLDFGFDALTGYDFVDYGIDSLDVTGDLMNYDLTDASGILPGEFDSVIDTYDGGYDFSTDAVDKGTDTVDVQKIPTVSEPPVTSTVDRGIVEYAGKIFQYVAQRLINGQTVWNPRQLTPQQIAALRAKQSPNYSGVLVPALIVGGLFLLASR